MKKSIFRMSTLGLLLIGGLMACKSNKKVAEATEPAPKVELETKKPEPPKAEIKTKTAKEETTQQLNNYFNAIVASSGNATTANRNISEAQSLFASPEVPVLIIISQYDGENDYDEPTNITQYLHYLKDKGKNLNNIHDFKTDANGKITELELIRK
ncbi:MAG TPA: nucleoid-structuring protein H-NS [Fulvivirga sp.]|nr:nucleoid-structuring protein H-NS [Fulvivirga sp.]